MTGLRLIQTIALNTVRDAVRSRVLYVLLFFSLVMIASSVTLAAFSYVERERIIQDIALSSIRFFGAAIAIFVGVGLIHREVERRTIYTILSKPVSRAQFLVGKYVGLVATLWMQLAIMAVGYFVICHFNGAQLDHRDAIAVGLIAVELSVVVAFATLFSSFATPFLAASYSIGLYMVGHLTRDLRSMGENSESELIGTLTLWLERLLPDLSAFNRVMEAIHDLPIPPVEAGAALLHGIGWTVAFLSIAAWTFERRDFR